MMIEVPLAIFAVVLCVLVLTIACLAGRLREANQATRGLIAKNQTLLRELEMVDDARASEFEIPPIALRP